MLNIKEIGKNNQIIKDCVKLNQKKYRQKFLKTYTEGRKLFIEVVKYNIRNLEYILITSEFKERFLNSESEDFLLEEYNILNQLKIPVYIIDINSLERISEQNSHDGIISVIQIPKKMHLNSKENLENKNLGIEKSNNFHLKPLVEKADILIVLDDISDPGNLGTILRTSKALGSYKIVVTENTVDVYSPKVLRSSMGAVFKLEIIKLKKEQVILLNKYKHMYYADMSGKSVYDIDFKAELKKENETNEFNLIDETEKNNKSGIGIIFGNEANGVSEEIKLNISNSLKIPMTKDTESLNVAISHAIILSEIIRQLNNQENTKK